MNRLEILELKKNEYSAMMGIKTATTSEILTFIENMMAIVITIKKTMRNTSTICALTKLRMTSTSEVQRWMISPVWWAVCQEKGSFWMCPYSASRSDLIAFSEALAVLMRAKKLKTPDRMAAASTAAAASSSTRAVSPCKRRCSPSAVNQPGSSSEPMIESTVMRIICGVSELKAVLSIEHSSPSPNSHRFSLTKRNTTAYALLF